MSTPTKTPSTPSPWTSMTPPTSIATEANITSMAISAPTANPNPTPDQATHLRTLETHLRALPESYFLSKVTTTNSIAESLFYGTHTTVSAALAALAPVRIGVEELAVSLAVQLVLTTQLLETRRVRKDIALRAIAKRQDGFSEGTMQEVWDEAWEEVKGEEEARRERMREERERREEVRKLMKKEEEKGEGQGEKAGGVKKQENKNGSQKKTERKLKEAAAEKGEKVKEKVAKEARKSGQGFMNGGVNCGEKYRMDWKGKE